MVTTLLSPSPSIHPYSPVLASQPHAPRWAMRSRASRASVTHAREGTRLSSATKPTPHASLSWSDGVYRPRLPTGVASCARGGGQGVDRAAGRRGRRGGGAVVERARTDAAAWRGREKRVARVERRGEGARRGREGIESARRRPWNGDSYEPEMAPNLQPRVAWWPHRAFQHTTARCLAGRSGGGPRISASERLPCALFFQQPAPASACEPGPPPKLSDSPCRIPQTE